MKRVYDQPQVQVTNISLSSQVLVGSPGANNAPAIHNIPTDEQW